MSTIHYVDAMGTYLGGFNDTAHIPQGAIKVSAPNHGKDTWDGTKWIPYEGLERDQAREDLAASDKDMARITEELVDLLLVKGLILPHELSDEAMDKLVARKLSRSKLG